MFIIIQDAVIKLQRKKKYILKMKTGGGPIKFPLKKLILFECDNSDFCFSPELLMAGLGL